MITKYKESQEELEKRYEEELFSLADQFPCIDYEDNYEGYDEDVKWIVKKKAPHLDEELNITSYTQYLWDEFWSKIGIY